MVEKLNTDTDLAELFGLEMDSGVDSTIAPVGVICPKCNGRGNFIGYTGRVVGKCFSCAGTGLAATAGIDVVPGTCTKCAGSGEWRPGRPCFGCNGTGKEVTAEAINVSAIAKAFAAARGNGIKSPKLRLAEFTFSRAPDTGKNAGSIYVKDKRGEYLGKVSDGQFRVSVACDGPTKARVIEVASNPHESAKAYGLKTGSCSCCGRELTNSESISLGIGPVCRDKFGWGG